MAPLGGWLIAQLPLSAFDALPMVVHCKFGSLPHPCSLVQVQHSTPLLLFLLDYSSLFIFSVLLGEGRFSLPRGCTELFSGGLVREVVHGA
jgi:hypothetical protein